MDSEDFHRCPSSVPFVPCPSVLQVAWDFDHRKPDSGLSAEENSLAAELAYKGFLAGFEALPVSEEL